MCMMSANCENKDRVLQNGEKRPCDACTSGLSRWIRKLHLDPLAVQHRAKQLRKWQDRMTELAESPNGRRYAKRIKKAFS